MEDDAGSDGEATGDESDEMAPVGEDVDGGQSGSVQSGGSGSAIASRRVWPRKRARRARSADAARQ